MPSKSRFSTRQTTNSTTDSLQSHEKENDNSRRHRPSQRSSSHPSASSSNRNDFHRLHSRRPVRSRIPGPDKVDRLGAVLGGVPYHHDGPYEATLWARQVPGNAPIDAVKETTTAVIAATPRANIVDCLENHYPLQGTAVIPPGVDGMGDYEEYDVMIKDGNYKRWSHIDYHDNDRKGKGEPSYTLDLLEKQKKAARRNRQENYEMQSPYKRHPSTADSSGRLEDKLSRLRQRLGAKIRTG